MLRKKVTQLQLGIQMRESLREGKMAAILTEDGGVDSTQQTSSHPLDGVKQEISEHKEKIQELCKENVHYYNLYLQKLDLLKDKVDTLEKKVVKYKELLSKTSDLPELMCDLQSDDQVPQLKETLEKDVGVVAAERADTEQRIKQEESAI